MDTKSNLRSSQGFETLLFQKPEPGIGHLILNRPESLNALSLAMVEELHELFDELMRSEEIRVLIISGAGRGFCSGADLRDERILRSAMLRDTAGHLEVVQRRFSSLVIEMRRLPQPIISIVHGPAAGGGMCIAIASDITIAGPRAAFTASFANIGLSGGELGTSYLLPRLAGIARASEILLTGRTVNAQEADRIGLVSLLVEKEELLMDVGMEKARALLRKSRLGLRLTKEVLNRSQAAPSLEAAICVEDFNQSVCVTSPDFLKEVERFQKKKNG
jgi:enoyl-CoA hydratase